MGCVSSKSLSFRDTFINLQARWHLQSDQYANVKKESVSERTKLFEMQETHRARQVSSRILLQGERVYACSLLLVEHSKLMDPPFFNEKKKRPLHAYSAILFHRLLGAVAAEHAYDLQKGEVHSARVRSFLARWDFRVWMIACCEFFHVLAVLQEQKALPKHMKDFMKSISSALRKGKAHDAQVGEPDGNEPVSVLLTRLWKEGSELQITPEMLPPKAIAALRTQLPGVFSTVQSAASGAADNPTSAAQLITQTREYETRLNKVMNLGCINPLYKPSVAESATSVSFLSFVEWVAVRYALSVSGAEEDPCSYGLARVNFSVEVLQHQSSTMQGWRERLRRLEAVEEQLAELEPLGDQSEGCRKLLTEKAELDEAFERFFAEWCGDHTCLTAADAATKCFAVLDIAHNLPDASAHTVLSHKAFENAVRGSASDTIDSSAEHRRYLKSYLALHDLYRDILAHQLEQLQKDGTYDASCLPGHVDFESFRTALWGAQARRDIELDPLMAAIGGGAGVLSAEEVADAFKRLFTVALTDAAGGRIRRGSLGTVWSTVAGESAAFSEAPPPRQPMEMLARFIGLNSVKECLRFITALLSEVFARSGNRLSNCKATLVAEALETVVKLPQYIDYSAGAAMLAICFAYLSPLQWSGLMGKEKTETALLVKWLYRIRSESADRISVGSQTNSDFFAHSLFAVAAAQRSFEDTMVAEAAHGPEIGEKDALYKEAASQATHHATKPHFCRAVAAMCNYLECSAEALLGNVSALLSSIPDKADGQDDELSGAAGFTVEDAFQEFKNAAAAVTAGSTLDDNGDGGYQGGEEVISVKHVLFVVVSNYTQLHCKAYWRNIDGYDLCDDAAFGMPLAWNIERGLLSLSHAMPLHSVPGTYREFAQLTEGAPAAGTGPGDARVEAAFQEHFVQAFYQQYKSSFDDLELDEEAVKRVAQSALQYVLSHGKRPTDAPGLNRNDYSAFLQYVLGHVMMQKAYESAVRDAPGAVDLRDTEADDEDVFLSQRDLGRILGCFSRLTEGGTPNVPTVEEAQRWLAAQKVDSGYEGFVLLQNAFLWYSAHRVELYALESLFTWWKETMAPRIPFTVSTDHRHKRRSAVREILRIKQNRRDADEDEPVELAEDEDGYLPVDIISFVMNRRSGLEAVTLRIFNMYEQESVTSCDTTESEETDSDVGEHHGRAAAWLQSCVRGLNAVVHRSDLGSREVHHSDYRFLLQYNHHFVSAYAGLYHVLTVSEVSSQSEPLEGGGDLITGVSESDRARLGELFAEIVLPLLFPAGTTPPEAVTDAVDTLLNKVWEEKSTRGFVPDLTVQEVAHGFASFFVRRSHEISARARQLYLDNRETQGLQRVFTTENAFLGALGGFEASAKLKYWERLRLLLPFGPSLRQRTRRRELFVWMDCRQRGYLTMSDLTAGLMDIVQLQSFRADFGPPLLRAFMATKEMTGQHQDVVYITQTSEEQVLMPSEMNSFLTYLYHYLELYFMFDVLTCGGHVNPKTLHVVQKEQSYNVDDDAEKDPPSSTKGGASPRASSGARGSRSPSRTRAASIPEPLRGGATALLEASKKQYQITLESAPMKKEISLTQFRIGGMLLRKWGAHVMHPDEVFHEVNSRRREAGGMSFIGFAIWASEHDLHPEGYGYGYDDGADAMATMEEQYSSL